MKNQTSFEKSKPKDQFTYDITSENIFSSNSKMQSEGSFSSPTGVSPEDLAPLTPENVDKYLRSREKKKVILGLDFVIDNFEHFDNKFLMKYMNGFVILLGDKIAHLQEKSLLILSLISTRKTTTSVIKRPRDFAVQKVLVVFDAGGKDDGLQKNHGQEEIRGTPDPSRRVPKE